LIWLIAEPWPVRDLIGLVDVSGGGVRSPYPYRLAAPRPGSSKGK